MLEQLEELRLGHERCVLDEHPEDVDLSSFEAELDDVRVAHSSC